MSDEPRDRANPGDDGDASDEREEVFQLASIAAHQLKSPLNTIHSVLATIVGGFLGPIDPRQRQLLERAAQSCTNSMKLVTDLLRLRSLGEIGADDLIPVNLVTTFEGAIERVRDAATAKSIELTETVAVEAKRLAWIRGEAGIATEVFYVLLDNAIKYTPQGGRVSAKLGLEDSPAEPGLQIVAFEVVDTGIGIPEDAYDKIFQEFYRAENTAGLASAGSGLGLSFAARAAKVMAGEISLAPAEEGGVRARVSFPQCPACVEMAEGRGDEGTLPWQVPDLDHEAEVSRRVVVIGGVSAGSKVAAKLTRLDPRARVTVVEKGRALSYAGCSLPYYISGIVREQSALAVTPLGEERDSALLHELKNVRTLNMSEAVSLDREKRSVKVRRLVDGSEQNLEYDQLVLAMGTRALAPEIEGQELAGVYRLDGASSAEAIRSELEGSGAKDVVIVGGGLVGSYMIEPVAMTGARVSVVEESDTILGIVDPELAMLVAHHLRTRGVKVHSGRRASAFVGEGRVRGVRLADGTLLPCDFVIVACGMEPETALARSAGLEIGPTGAIRRDSLMRTSDEAIYAIGDCAEKRNGLTGEPDWMPSGGVAVREGRAAALNICGGQETEPAMYGSAVMQLFGLTVARTGLGEIEAREQGFDPVTALVPSLDAAHYMPTAKRILVKLIADRSTGRLLGAQGIGEGRLAKRIDTATTAIAAGMSVDDFAALDLGFAPPVSIPIDGLVAAANVIRNKRAGLVEGLGSAELKRRIESDDPPMIVDVRLPSGHDRRRLAKSVNIPLGSLRGRIHELPRDRELVIVSRTGLKSYEAALILSAAGFERPIILDGGLESWPYELEQL